MSKVFGPEMEFKKDAPNPMLAPVYDGYYREGTRVSKVEANFLIFGGGIGDYICWMSAIDWVLATQHQVTMNLYVQGFFLEIANKLFVPKYRNVRVRNILELAHVDMSKLGYTLQPRNDIFPNALGMNLTDLGFVFFANHMPEGKWREHVRLDVSDIAQPVDLPKNYAVITTGHTTKAREWRPEGINAVSKWLVEQGVTPVFLGKTDMFVLKAEGLDAKYTASFSEGIDYSLGIDLREKTTLLQAVRVMAGAKVVVGLDNGLLHLAGTQDVPIVMGMNIAKPAEREIRRPAGSGRVQYLTPDPKVLKCTFCQSNMRFNVGQDFKVCTYGDYACLDMFKDPKPWTDAISQVWDYKKEEV